MRRLFRGTELSPEMREALAELRQGQLTQEEALAELEKLQAMLDGELDPAQFAELMESMGEALESASAALADGAVRTATWSERPTSSASWRSR